MYPYPHVVQRYYAAGVKMKGYRESIVAMVLRKFPQKPIQIVFLCIEKLG